MSWRDLPCFIGIDCTYGIFLNEIMELYTLSLCHELAPLSSTLQSLVGALRIDFFLLCFFGIRPNAAIIRNSLSSSLLLKEVEASVDDWGDFRGFCLLHGALCPSSISTSLFPRRNPVAPVDHLLRTSLSLLRLRRVRDERKRVTKNPKQSARGGKISVIIGRDMGDDERDKIKQAMNECNDDPTTDTRHPSQG